MAILLAPLSPLLAHQLVTNGPNFDPVNHAPSVAHMRMHKRSAMGWMKNFRYSEFLVGMNLTMGREFHNCICVCVTEILGQCGMHLLLVCVLQNNKVGGKEELNR